MMMQTCYCLFCCIALLQGQGGWSFIAINSPTRSRSLNYGTRPSRVVDGMLSRLAEASTEGPSFLDFSAPSEWDTFYQQHKEKEDVMEWHSSISLERIGSFLLDHHRNSSSSSSNIHIDNHHYETAINHDEISILMVGCGNSRLPATILSMCQASNIPSPRMVLLDTSQTCLDQLREIYGSRMDYVCGDATQLPELFASSVTFDWIVDKGLADAIFCSEGWNGPMERLFKGAAQLLAPRYGRYLLISYRQPSSTQAFLQEIGDEVGLNWNFDVEEISSARVGVSLARKRSVD